MIARVGKSLLVWNKLLVVAESEGESFRTACGVLWRPLRLIVIDIEDFKDYTFHSFVICKEFGF